VCSILSHGYSHQFEDNNKCKRSHQAEGQAPDHWSLMEESNRNGLRKTKKEKKRKRKLHSQIKKNKETDFNAERRQILTRG
jgi:hypothetical protein